MCDEGHGFTLPIRMVVPVRPKNFDRASHPTVGVISLTRRFTRYTVFVKPQAGWQISIAYVTVYTEAELLSTRLCESSVNVKLLQTVWPLLAGTFGSRAKGLIGKLRYSNHSSCELTVYAAIATLSNLNLEKLLDVCALILMLGYPKIRDSPGSFQ